jgi:hypothetical protein
MICARPPLRLSPDAWSCREADGSAAAFLRSTTHTVAVGVRRAGRPHHLRRVAQPAACAVLRWLARRHGRAASARSGVGVCPGWRLPGPPAPAWGSDSCTPGHPAALLTVEEARGRSVKVPVTGAGSLFCVGAVFGPDRRLPCRARTPCPGTLTSAMQSRTAKRDQLPGTECGWLRVRPPGRWLRHPQRRPRSRPWSASGAG